MDQRLRCRFWCERGTSENGGSKVERKDDTHDLHSTFQSKESVTRTVAADHRKPPIFEILTPQLERRSRLRYIPPFPHSSSLVRSCTSYFVQKLIKDQQSKSISPRTSSSTHRTRCQTRPNRTRAADTITSTSGILVPAVSLRSLKRPNKTKS